MKKLTVSTIAALMLASGAAFAETKIINGCEVLPIPNSNAFYRADPTCSIGYEAQGDGGFSAWAATFRNPVEEPPVDEPELPTCRVTGC